MSFIIGVRFAEVGKIYYFDPGKLELQLDDKVIVETARGVGRIFYIFVIILLLRFYIFVIHSRSQLCFPVRSALFPHRLLPESYFHP